VRSWLLAALAACGGDAGVTVSIAPAEPTTVDDLVATVTGADHAELVWRRDDELVGKGASVSAALTAKHETWTVQVVRGPVVVAEASVVVANAPPEVDVTLEPDARRGEKLDADVEVHDADGDEVTVTWLWYRDGALQDGLDDDDVPGAELFEGESWEVEVVADDGEDRTSRRAGPTVVTRPGARLIDDLLGLLVDLQLPDDAWRSLQRDPTTWVRADLTWDDQSFPNVGVRLKGRGSFEPLGQRPSLLVDTDRFVPGQRVDGIDAFALDNMHSDPSLLRERVAYALFREVGVPAPRAVHVGLTLQGVQRGPYTLVEGVDGRFLDAWFGDGDGALYEMPGSELDEEGVWALDHDGGTDDRTPLLDLAALLADPNASLSLSGADLLDVDAWARYLAACGVVGHYDGYPFNAPGDDLYLYVDPADGRIRFAAHGADEAFTDAERPVSYLHGDLGQRCLREAPCRDAFVDAVWAFEQVAEDVDLAGYVDLAAHQVSLLLNYDARLDFDPRDRATHQRAVKDFVLGRRAALEQMIVLQ
jgi:hypothetical protein